MENSFEYTYSAPQQEEIRRIREKYQPREESKLERLRRLDKSVTRAGTVWSIAVGVIGTLVMGAGMSCSLVGPQELMLPGVAIGILGIAILACAYPLYGRITRRQRERLAPEILKLTDELLQ